MSLFQQYLSMVFKRSDAFLRYTATLLSLCASNFALAITSSNLYRRQLRSTGMILVVCIVAMFFLSANQRLLKSQPLAAAARKSRFILRACASGNFEVSV